MQQEMAGKNPNQITSPGVRQQNKLNAQQVQKPLGRCTVLEMRSLGNHWKKWASFSQLMHQENIAIWIFCRKNTPKNQKQNSGEIHTLCRIWNRCSIMRPFQSSCDCDAQGMLIGKCGWCDPHQVTCQTGVTCWSGLTNPLACRPHPTHHWRTHHYC